ncbi:MAG: DUF3800 domain-containing protein [Lachnospiraceae bacterium]|nr:DUF3800 domain-containing protein [Lachnospiraceae bacterium]
MAQQLSEYILFADETKKTSVNQYFCFAGLIIKRGVYENILIPEINKLKQNYFNSTDVVFHYTEMKNNKGVFNIFRDNTIRNKFWTDFYNTMNNIDFTTMGVYFDQSLMKNLYKGSGTTNYDIAYRHLLENYMHFLKGNDGIGSVCIESRTFKENVFLQKNHFDYLENGSIYYSNKEVVKYLSSIGFIIKGDNCVGLQIADIIPARFMRIVNKQKDNNNLNELFHKKMYYYNTKEEKILGLKNLL